MASNSIKEDFAQELLNAIRHGTFTRNSNASDRINSFAEAVKRRLDELTDVLDNRGLEYYPRVIEVAEALKDRLEKAMENRRTAQASGMVGNVLRITGALGYVFPIGRVAFWSGCAVSLLSDMIANNERKDIGDTSSQLRRILQRDREGFRARAIAIRNLDETIESETGWSLYDEEFREFLRNVAGAPERVEDLVARNTKIEDPENRTNLIELARNPRVIRILTDIVEGFQRKDVILLNLLTQGLYAYNFLESCPMKSATFQLGELAVRGLALYVEYEQDGLTLKQFEEGIARMHKELQAIRKVYPDF